MSIVKRLTEYWQGMPARSPRWAAVRAQWLKWHPTCAACGTRDKLEVHHIRPFHLHPELELDSLNLLTLCENGGNCHLVFGHLKSWKSHNPAVCAHASQYLQLIQKRP